MEQEAADACASSNNNQCASQKEAAAQEKKPSVSVSVEGGYGLEGKVKLGSVEVKAGAIVKGEVEVSSKGTNVSAKAEIGGNVGSAKLPGAQLQVVTKNERGNAEAPTLSVIKPGTTHGNSEVSGWKNEITVGVVIVNLSGSPITLLGAFEKNPARWATMPYLNVHDGTTHTLKPPTVPVLPQTFEMVLSQYIQHREHKSLGPDGKPCDAHSKGLLKRYPVTGSEFHLIGKETERGWEQAEDISTLLPSLKRYEGKPGTASELSRERLQKISLNALQKETGLSRNTVLRARRGQRVHSKSLQRLRIAASAVRVSPGFQGCVGR